MAGSVPKPTLKLLKSCSEEIAQILASPWIPYNLQLTQIRDLLETTPSYEDCQINEINLAGAPNSPFLYTVDINNLIVLIPKSTFDDQPFIRELKDIFSVHFDLEETESAVLYISNISSAVKIRLGLPRVLLINLFHPEMYPTFRFTLGISSIASYLRQYNSAKVDIIDCQFGKSISELIEYILSTRPNIIGISVNFGQFDLMEQLIDEIYKEKPLEYEPILVLGNVLPALCSEEILARYPKVIICNREGENSLVELCRKYKLPDQWKSIPNICYKTYDGKLIRTIQGNLSCLTDRPAA